MISGAVWYARHRFRPDREGIALAGAYLCMLLLWLRMNHAQLRIGAVLAGGCAFVLLFLQLRLLDDICDFDSDGGSGSRAGAPGRGALTIAWFTIALANVALGVVFGAVRPVSYTEALLAVAALLALRVRVSSAPLAFVLFEGQPALVLTFAWWFLAELSHASFPPGSAAVVVTFFWGSYEFWKFARKRGDPDWRPFGWNWGQQRLFLSAIIAGNTASALLLVAIVPMSRWYMVYAMLNALVFAFDIWTESTSSERKPPRKLRSFAFPASAQLGILGDLLLIHPFS